MWNVRLFYNTGLNSCNIVDGPGRLNSAQHIDLPALDILQGEGLSAVNVKATRDQVKNADFMYLMNTDTLEFFFYSVNAFQMSSQDVATLSVTLDALMTLEQLTNGIGNIEFLDGITERHHVAKDDDLYGAYTEDDPLLIPSEELKINTGMQFTAVGNQNKKVIIESTISLDIQAEGYKAITYTDGENKVTVPTVVPVTENTRVTVAGVSYISPGSEYFDYSKEDVQKGIQQVRSLGVESGILNSYTLYEGTTGQEPGADCVFVPTEEGRILGIQGVDVSAEVNNISPNSFPEAQNKRILYGSSNMIEMCSPASGARASFKPENVFIDQYGALTTLLEVRKITDPRPNGRPYFVPKWYRSSASDYEVIFGGLANAVPGMQWANAPLVYTGKSGSTLDQIAYDTTMSEVLSDRYANQMSNIVGTTMSNVGAVSSAFGMNLGSMNNVYGGGVVGQTSTGSDIHGGYNFGSVKGRNAARAALRENQAIAASNARTISGWAGETALNIIGNEVSYALNDWNLERSYNLTARRELQNLMIGTSVVSPVINFPNSETMRDFMGNGLFVIQYHPSDNDMRKLDKILTMYGYKDTKPLEKTDFTNRKKFNYVQARGVSIGGNFPKWLREAAAAQLAAGVRVWHQLPDVKAYTDGSNV